MTDWSATLTTKGRNGHVTPIPMLRLLDMREVDEETGCWNFTGTLNNKGYGRFVVNGRRMVPHRFTYEQFLGPIPEGLVLDHLCKNPRCVNPFHCEPVTNAENIRRGTQGWNMRAKTHCPRGHEYSEENTYRLHRRNSIERHCRACGRERMRERRARA